MSKRTIGWGIIIAAIIISFIISFRDTLFNGQPLDSTNFIMTVIIACASVVAYALATSVGKKKDGK